jgi:hypothetical protein
MKAEANTYKMINIFKIKKKIYIYTFIPYIFIYVINDDF